MRVKEDAAYLKSWQSDAVKRAHELSERARERGARTVFTISSTAKPTAHRRPYLTPLRQNNLCVYSGAVVFTQTQAVLLCRCLDGMVDYILVDAEKKFPIILEPDTTVLIKEERERMIGLSDTVLDTHSGNLAKACHDRIHKSRFYEFKPNDITANAVWHLVSKKLQFLSGRRIAIIGCGNIGFKLALKLLESDATVNLVRRDVHAGFHLANTMNMIKPASTLAHANFTTDGLKAAYRCDALIGCSSEPEVVTWDMVAAMHQDGFVVDVGKGNLTPEAIEKSLKRGMQVIRADITAALDGEIITILRNEKLLEEEMGRNTVSGLTLVSGGVFGLAGDLVVDKAAAPAVFFGVSDGAGELKQPGAITAADQRGIRRLRALMEAGGGR